VCRWIPLILIATSKIARHSKSLKSDLNAQPLLRSFAIPLSYPMPEHDPDALGSDSGMQNLSPAMMNNDLDKITDKRPATKKTSAPYPKQWARSSSSSYARNGVFKKTEYTDVPLALILGSKDTKLYFFKQ
jgi:hypothetical protein